MLRSAAVQTLATYRTLGHGDIEELVHELKGQEVVLIIAPLGPAEELPVICGLCGTPYDGGECPTCKAEREEAKRVIEERLRRNKEDKDRLIRDVEKWLEQRRPQ